MSALAAPAAPAGSGTASRSPELSSAIVRDPRDLILDEPTSALDADSENMVRAALATPFRDRTTRITYIEKGRIFELGSHDERMALGNS